MEEMSFFNNLISTFESDTQVVWGIKQVEESDLLRVAMLFNYSHKWAQYCNFSKLCPKSAHRIRNFAHNK